MKLTNQHTVNFQKAHALLKKSAVKKAEPKTAPKPQQVSTTPQETFVPSAQPVAPVKAEAVVEAPKTEPKAAELKKPRAGSDMAVMLEDIQHAKQAGGEIKANNNGSLVVLEDPFMPSSLPGSDKAGSADGHGAHGHHGHHAGHDAAMAGQLNTKVVEKLGYYAQKGGDYGTGNAVSTATAKTAGTVKSQASDAAHSTLAEAATQKAAQAGQQLAEVKGEVVSSLADVKSNAVQQATDKISGAATQGAETTATQGAQAVKEAGAEVAKHGADAANISTGLATALAGASVASGGIGAYMLYEGGKELAHGVKEKNGEKIAEGVGGLAVGARSVAASTVMASMVSSSPTLASVASVAGQALTPLGVLHGAIDIGLGVKDIAKGEDKVGGGLKVALGTTLIAASVGGGIPAIVGALGILGVKVTRDVMKNRKAKKQAAAQEQKAPQAQAQPQGNVATKEA